MGVGLYPEHQEGSRKGSQQKERRAQPQHLVERDKAEDVKFKKVLERKPQ